MTGLLDDYSIDVDTLEKKYCNRPEGVVIRANPRTDHVFSELYNITDKQREGYLKLKVLEVLLFLSDYEICNECVEPRYYTSAQVNASKKVAGYLAEHTESHFTIQELSQKFDISPTLLKTCFKYIYGVSVSSFARKCKMAKAAQLLKQTNLSIIEIAGVVGYDNGSKFAGAFKKCTGLTPTEYRKSDDQMKPYKTFWS